MSFILGGGKSQASQQSVVSGLQLQSSSYGKIVPLVYGTTLIAPNLIWYGDFTPIAHQSSPGGGGKGGSGGGGGGGKSGGGSTSYTYQTAVAMGLCEGPIGSIPTVYADKNITSPAALGLTGFAGNYGQATWGYLASVHPLQSIGYSGIAYAASSAYQLGTSPQLPNHNFEVNAIFSYGLAGIPDADPSMVVADFLTNPHYGCGLPSARLGSLSVYQGYCIANGLWISPAYTDQSQASTLLDTIATATNSAFVWSSGVLTLVPYGDTALNANGFVYTPPSAPLYDLTDDDFLPTNATDDRSPVILTRARPADAINVIKLECLDRANRYNPAIVEAKDQAMLETYGIRQVSSVQMHLFADVNAARLSVQLQLHRQAIRNIYQFTLDQRYVLLDPMDIVSLTDSYLGLSHQWVRITAIAENNDGTLNVTAEEYLNGTGHAPLYSFQSGQGFSVNYNADPGPVNDPVIFEPTALLAEGLEVWAALSGGRIWGGADVYISSTGDSYRLAGRVTGQSRTGELTAVLPVVTPVAGGQTIDATHTLGVDLSESGGQLLSGTQADAVALNTLCYVDGEYIAYQTATLTGSNEYALGYLVRGAYGSPIASHAPGSRFARIDGNILKIPYTPDFIGTTLYIKCVSFNIYHGGQQTLADVLPYTFRLQGAAYASALPDVTNLRSSYVASITQLTWDEVTDFRSVLYEIRKGAEWTGAQLLSRVAHPPFAAQGNGTYWVAAYSQPMPGLQVYSNDPQDIVISGAQIVQNVIASWDEAASGWSGALSGYVTVRGGNLVTTGSGNILAIANYLSMPDILDYGGEGDGVYTIPSSHIVGIGRVAPCNVIISWTANGQHQADNILQVGDYLGDTDILDFAASASISVYPEIALSQDGVSWGAWQKYSAGAYSAKAYNARISLNTSDPGIEAIVSSFVFEVDVPDRTDHYVGINVPTGGLNLLFAPDGGAAASFNGGPGSASVPAVQVTILNATSGDTAVISALTLGGCTIQILNAGSPVSRNVNILAEGY